VRLRRNVKYGKMPVLVCTSNMLQSGAVNTTIILKGLNQLLDEQEEYDANPQDSG